MSLAREPLRVGVIGTGSLGRHHVRLLAELDDADLVGIHDLDPERAREIAERYGTRAFADRGELADAVEAVVVAVPTVDHCELTCDLLGEGLHVLVEKPMATSLAEADAMLAARRDGVLAVGHVEFYNPAVSALLARSVRPGFVEIERLSTFTARSLDIDVVLDLMIHDLQILHALDPSPIAEVRAVGVSVLSERFDMANCRIELESGCVANLTASRVSAERVRRLRVFLAEDYLSLDYAEQSLRGFRLGNDGADPAERIEAVVVPVTNAEPLRCELERFVAAARGDAVAYVDGDSGRRALESALRVVDEIKGV